DKDELCWYSNRGDGARSLGPGIYGVSNRLLDTPWPKVTRAKEAFQRLLSNEEKPDPEGIFHLLVDRSIADDKDLPDTGVEIEWERILSPIFITSPVYGTRSSTIILIDTNDHVTFIERTFNSDMNHAPTARYEFRIES
ncbi:MAG: NRDE family protein, partial [Desulfobacteraceae bacterium]|nr:NRDE family protein [Desulfobacteraceae bacterium]